MAAIRSPGQLDTGLGRLRTLTEEEEIAQSIRMILTTQKGERPMRPEFGTHLSSYLFAGRDSTTNTRIRQEVLSALETWEPRIEGVEVTVEQPPEEGTLLLHVSYRIKATGAPGRETLSL